MEGRNKRILLVDDAEAVRDVLLKILSVMGLEVTAARNGNEGLNLFLENAFDPVMTDLEMPGIDGWTLAFHVKDQSPHTPVVLITGQKKESVMEKLEHSSVDEAMLKPFRLEDIDKTFQRMFGKTAH